MSRLEKHRPNWTAILAVIALALVLGGGPVISFTAARTAAGVNVLLVVLVIVLFAHHRQRV